MNTITQKGLKFNIKVIEPFHDVLKGDPTRLKQIIANLISNALKFTHEGNISIEASSKVLDGKVEVSIRISDTGIGIDKSKQSLIFEAFNQEDLSTTRKFGGTGLGLTIVRELLKLMQGSIELDSEPEKGSTFICRFLLSKGEIIQQAPTSIKANPSQVKLEAEDGMLVKGHILLAEDQQINQIVAKIIIEEQGFTCKVANNGQEVIDILKTEPEKFQLILMDCQMPIKDGYTAAREIRKGLAGEENKTIPIIAMTANAMKGDREKCIDSGMNDYIAKPITPEIVIEKLNNWYKNSQK